MGSRSCSFLPFLFLDEEGKGCFLGLGCGVAALLMLKDHVLDLDFCVGENPIWGLLEGVLVAFLCLVPEPDLLLPVGGERKKES